MSLFNRKGKQDDLAAVLDARREKLDDFERVLKSKKSDLDKEMKQLADAKAVLELEKETFRIMMKTNLEDLAAEKAALEVRRIELIESEAKAKAEFSEAKQEAFNEVFEKRSAYLDTRQKELNEYEERLAKSFEEITKKFKELSNEKDNLAKRKLALIEQEQKVNADYTEQTRSLVESIEHQHRANQEELDRIQKHALQLAEERKQLREEKLQLISKENELLALKQKFDQVSQEDRIALNAELREKRKQAESNLEKYKEKEIASLKEFIAVLKDKRLKEVEKEEDIERKRIQEEVKKERERILAEIAEERSNFNKKVESERKQLQKEWSDLKKYEGTVNALKSQLEGLQIELENNEKELEHKEQRLEQLWQKRNDQLDEEIDKRVETERKLITEKHQALEKNEKELENKEQQLEQLWQKRNDQLDEEIDKRVETERKLITEKHQALEKSEKELENKEQQLKQLWQKRNDQLDEEIDKRVETERKLITEKHQALEKSEKELEHKEQQLEQLWQKRNDQLDEEIDKRVETERKLITEKHQALEKSKKELENKEQQLEQLWQKRNDQLDEEIDKRVETERKLITEKYQALEKEEKELEHKEQRLEQLWHKRNDQLNEEVEKRVETERKLVTEKLQALEKREKELENKEQRLEQLWHKRNDQLDQEVENRVEDKYQIIIADLKDLKYRNHYLSERNNTQSQLIAAFEHLQLQLDGQNPADVIKELNSKTEEIKNLQNEISTRPVVEIERYKDLKKERDRLHARNEKLLKENQENAEILQQANEDRLKVHNLINENQVLKQIAERMEGAANEAHEELRRLRAAYASPSEIKARHKEIEEPHIKMEKIGKPCKEETLDENVWLTGIEQKCNEYGLHFHPRILRAFHTALKTAEWSPITVLAGVSGTGKSELPRLYSHFGGLLFHPISVQPNWDSQESMLGFFNSIENKFDAQPVLRFLAQSQKEWDIKDEYPGLQEFLCLILLDEMNLAHPELYFAEFLSKLELRRGMKRKDVPILPVKIGSGMEAYPLPLGRNVLWTGTMNQDETTKSLSDKVLDRSIIIYFPRPKELKRRTELKALDEENRGLLMKRNIWEKWLSKESKFKDEEIKPFKDFVEDMNESLAVVGRAIGHRVWQSVEYYMMNYPDVRAARNEKDKNALNKALHTAFEDQLVQKIMPKLRGIDTRGKSKTECLDKILEQINRGIGGNPFNLREDFNLACELGYGQFIWQSANYLKEESTQIFENTDEKITEVTKKTSKAKKRAK